MKVTAVTVFIYALIVFVGGLIGYYKTDSLASLLCGSVFGVLLMICSYAISKGKNPAQIAALAITFLLDGFFTYRFAKTLHFLPAGLMSLLSLTVLIVIALKIRKTYRLYRT